MVFRLFLPLIFLTALIIGFQNCSESNGPNLQKSNQSSNQPAPEPESKTCETAKGTILQDGETEDGLFKASSVTCGNACEVASVTCNDGVLEGEGVAAECNISQCHSKSNNSDVLSGLLAGETYMVSVYGITENRGDNNLQSITVSDCDGNVLQSTPSQVINWHDGQAPHSTTMAVEVPADGCIRAETDMGPALAMTATQAQGEASSVNGSVVNNLEAGANYMVTVYGVTTFRGDGNNTMLPVEIQDCVDQSTIASHASMVIDWHDGQVGQGSSIPIVAPAGGCIIGVTDGGNALKMTVEKIEKSVQEATSGTIVLLKPGAKYKVHVFGVIGDRGTGNILLNGVGLTDCTDTPIVGTDSLTIGWPDGQAPQDHTFVVDAPADGCLRGVTDLGPAAYMSAVEL